MRATTCLRLSVGVCLLALATAATAQNAMTTESADIYAGPDNSYPQVAQLDPDTPIQVMGCLDDWSWCDVDFDGNRGWLYSPDIAYQYQGGYAPLYSYAPGLGVPVVAFSFDTYWGNYYHDRPFFRQREQWAHRSIHHQRPPGPRPSSSPPPRQAVRNIRPHEGPQSDHDVHLGRGEPSRQQTEHSGSGAHINTPAPDPRHHDRSPPPGPRPEMNTRPPGNVAPPRSAEPQRETQREPQREPQREEQHLRPGASGAHVEPQRAEPQHRAEPPRPEPQKPEPPKN